jgi:hypothetical protein
MFKTVNYFPKKIKKEFSVKRKDPGRTHPRPDKDIVVI